MLYFFDEHYHTNIFLFQILENVTYALCHTNRALKRLLRRRKLTTHDIHRENRGCVSRIHWIGPPATEGYVPQMAPRGFRIISRDIPLGQQQPLINTEWWWV